MYSVGDKVVHPGYGPGVIRSIERRQVIGEAKQYYIVDIVAGSGTLMTPVSKAKQVGLRLAISDAAVEQLLESLAQAPRALSSDFRKRQTEIEERLKEADAFATAKVIRDLAWYGRMHGLTRRDEQLMQRAEELVAGELALVKGIEVEAAIDQVQSVLDEAMRDRAVS